MDNLLVRIHFIIVMIRWTGLAPWEFEFPFPGAAEHVAPPTRQCQTFFHEACGNFARCPGCFQDAAPGKVK